MSCLRQDVVELVGIFKGRQNATKNTSLYISDIRHGIYVFP
jgi:hypothetical protein